MDKHSVVDDRLAITVALGAALFVVVTAVQVTLDPTPGARPASSVAAVTAVVLAVIAWTLWRRPRLITSRSAPALVTVAALVVAANPVAYVLFTHVAYPSIGTLLVIVGIGALVPYPRIALALIVGLNVAALVLAWCYPQAAPLGVVAVQLLKADVLALVIALTWRRTERRLEAATETIAHMAVADELTGLLNRRGLTERGQAFVDAALASGNDVIVAFIDVNNLKGINDCHGHFVGDSHLAGIGQSLRWVLDEGGLAAWVGGDEFALIARGGPDEVSQFRSRVEHLRARVPHFGVAIGWAQCGPDDAGALRVLINEADRMMLRHKRRPN